MTEVKASYPELVDLKITDFCTQGCAFCYQNSSPQGKHASRMDVSNILRGLGRVRLFEVAIGGGEPIDHPDFLEFLWVAKSEGIVPNFSTKKVFWLDDDFFRRNVYKCMGGVAFSVTNPKEVAEIGKRVDYYEEIDRMFYDSMYSRRKRVYLQIIPELLNKYTLEAIFRQASKYYLPVTLLGLKTVGRASDWDMSPTKKTGKFVVANPNYNANWEKDIVDIVDNSGDRYVHIGADTAIMKKAHLLKKRFSIPRYAYYKTEGSFSMYIDAVEMKAGPSSYCPDEMMRPLDLTRWLYSKTGDEYFKDLFKAVGSH